MSAEPSGLTGEGEPRSRTRCDRCGNQLIYLSKIIAIIDSKPIKTRELEGGRIEEGEPEAKYHPECFFAEHRDKGS